MEARLIHPFIEAVQQLFKEYFSSEVEIQNPYWMESSPQSRWEISAMIGIAGDSRGCVSMSFSEQTARKLTEALMGNNAEISDEDMLDSIGEAVNIVAGNAKKGLEQYRLMISLPMVIRGNSHELSCPGKEIPLLGIPLMTPFGEAHLAIGLENIIKK